MTSKVILKVDSNGTKFSVTERCPRCGGRGDYVLGSHNYGTCFACGGTGSVTKEVAEEHAADLAAHRQSTLRVTESDDDILARKYADYGCGRTGIGYALTGKTYPIKDEIKAKGGRWVSGAWVCPVAISAKGVTVREINLAGHIGSGSQLWLDDYDLYEAIHG